MGLYNRITTSATPVLYPLCIFVVFRLEELDRSVGHDVVVRLIAPSGTKSLGLANMRLESKAKRHELSLMGEVSFVEAGEYRLEICINESIKYNEVVMEVVRASSPVVTTSTSGLSPV